MKTKLFGPLHGMAPCFARYPLICPGVHLSGSFFSAIYRVRVRVRVSRVSRVSRVGRVSRV